MRSDLRCSCCSAPWRRDRAGGRGDHVDLPDARAESGPLQHDHREHRSCPAETLPARFATLLGGGHARCPASPSGGHSGTHRLQLARTRSRQPRALRRQRACRPHPARSTFGQDVPQLPGKSLRPPTMRFKLICSMPASESHRCQLSMGNIPDASPIPTTRCPVSFQWM